MEISIAFLSLAILVISIAFYKGFKIVPQAETMVIERLGRYNRTLQPGINVIWPIIEKPKNVDWKFLKTDVSGKTIISRRAVPNIDLRETVYDFPKQNVITRDNVAIEINALLYFQIIDPRRSVYEIANLPDAIEKLAQVTLRNVIGELDLDQTLTSRDTINSKLRSILDEATDKWGIQINRVELQDIIPPEDIKSAMEKQMRAERDRRAKILEAEGQKQKDILEAEGMKQAEISHAEGQRQSEILRASGQAEAKIKVAQAEAETVERMSEAVSSGGGDPIQYLVALKYIEALREMVRGEGNKVIYLPYEATALLGSVSSLKDLFESSTDL